MNKKQFKLKHNKPKKHRIYGIFNLKTKKLVYVDLDLDQVTLNYDIDNYPNDVFKIVQVDVLLY